MLRSQVSFRCLSLIICQIMLMNAAACTTAARTSAPLNGDEGNVVITFAGWASDRQFYEPLMAAFHTQNPGITVQFAALPDYTAKNTADVDAYYRRLVSGGDTLLLGGKVPTNVVQYFQDLQPLMESDAAFAPDDFWPGALDACRDSAGRLLGIPVDIGFQGIFYDSEAFKTAGLPSPQPGWTWDDFRIAVTALAQQEGETIRYGYAERSVSLLSPLIAAAIEEAGGEIDPAALQAHTQWYLDLVHSGAIYLFPDGQDSQGQTLQAWDDLFKSETRPAMWTGSLAEAMPGDESVEPNAALFAKAAFKTHGFVPYPVAAGDAEAHTSPAWVECAAVSAGSPHPRQAWAWLNFLSQHRLVRNSNDAWEIVNAPGRISVTESSSYWKNLPAEMEPPVRYILQHAWYGTAYPEVSAAVSTALAKAATGETDFASALNESRAQLAAAPQPTPNRTPITVATPNPITPVDVTEIRYGYRTYGEVRQAIKAAAAAYNQDHPDVVVKVSTDFDIPETDPLLPRLAGKFDCFTSMPFNLETQEPGNLFTLDAFLDAEGSQFVQDFDPVLLDVFRYQGELYGLPAFSDLPVMVYNADLLAKRGLQPPANDWTFSDFIEMMNASASTVETDRSYGFLFNPFDDLFFAGRGVLWADFNADPPVPMLDSPEFTSALGWLSKMNESGVLLVQQADSDVRQAVLAGKVAFWTTLLEQPGDWFSEQRPNFKISIAPMPAMQSSYRIVSWGVQGHFISSKAREPQLCWNWIKFLSEQPAVFKGIPARTSVAQSPEWEAIVGAENAAVYRLAIFNAIRERPKEERFNPVAWPIYLWQQQAVTAMVQGEDYHKLLPDLQKKAEDYLHCMELVDRSGLTEGQLNTEIQRCANLVEPGENGGP